MDNSSKRPEPYANLYLVECAHRRGKLGNESIFAPKEQNHSPYLGDELVVEILCRLPSSKYAFHCKCVCKRWFALISSPYFVSRFLASKPEVESATSERTYGILARLNQTPSKLEAWKGFIMYLGDPVYDTSITAIPQCGDLNATPPTVKGAYNDLLLLCTDELDMSECYICNVQTRQWVQLPSLPPSPIFDPRRRWFNVIGFICDPYYSHASKLTLNAAYSYSVVVIPERPKHVTRFRAQMFSSNTGHWTEITIKTSCRVTFLGGSCGIDFGGVLYFVCTGGLIRFDPASSSTDGVYQCHFIGLPVGRPSGFGTYAVYQGHLQRYAVSENNRLYVCALKDYKTSEWCLVLNIAMQDFELKDNFLDGFRKKHKQLGYVLCQHPTNPHIFYLKAGCFVVLCNVSTKTADVVSYITQTSNKPMPHYLPFQLKLPIWPTPIPALLP